ncbi:hypothetical protein [Pontiella sp.]|uniref:hypothetical protein n=1 Tax=Pontiella sp. TaxID=2837462 RepID=UPI003562A8B8
MYLKPMLAGSLSGLLALGAVAGSNETAQVLKTIQKPVDEILQIHGEYDGLPKFHLFKRDRKKADGELRALHEGVLEALQISGIGEFRTRYFDLQQKIEKMNVRIVEYTERKLVAPTEDDLMGWKTTKSDLDKKIANAEEYIADVRAEQDRVVEELRDLFKTNGLEIATPQAKLFLSLSKMEGEGYLDLCGLFINVKMLSNQLAEQIRAGEANPDVLKRYYGLYVVLNDAMLLGYRNVLETIDGVYLVRVDELGRRMLLTQKETERLLRTNGLSDSQKAILEGNLEAQGHFIDVCGKVQEYMRTSHKRLGEEVQRLSVDVDVAKNTYKTAWVGAELLDTFEQFETSFKELRELTVDPVIPLNDPAIMKQFDDLTEKLRLE